MIRENGPFAGAAGELAGAGWAVHPLRGKLPLLRHGVLEASSDPGQVAAWAHRWPWANIGARVPDGLIVLDVDPRNGGLESLLRLEHAYRRMPATLTVWSGRGDGGRHLYFRRPEGDLTGAHLPAGLDLKKSGGYCLMPPSVHPDTGGRYQWEDPAATIAACPAWIAQLLRPRQRRARASGEAHDGDRLVKYVAGLGEGTRNAGLYWAACRARDEGRLDHLEAPLVNAATRCGLDQREAAQTIASARRGSAA